MQKCSEVGIKLTGYLKGTMKAIKFKNANGEKTENDKNYSDLNKQEKDYSKRNDE